MRLSTKTRERWAPDWNENLEQPENERVYITIEYPDQEQKESLRRRETKFQVLKDQEKEDEIEERNIIVEAKYDIPLIMKRHVPAIENLDDVVDGKLVHLSKGADLLKSRNRHIMELIEKIIARIEGDEIPEAEEKNSEQPST